MVRHFTKSARKLIPMVHAKPYFRTFFYILFFGMLVSFLLPSCSHPPVSAPQKPTAGSEPPANAKVKPYKVLGEWYHPISDASSFAQEGIASWYGKKFHGRKTANGETYNMYAMTAAHKTLPLGTHVTVENLNNGKKISVRINDRGPFVRGRIIDLTYTGAKKLDMLGPGTAPVRIVALSAPRSVTVEANPDLEKEARETVNIFETGKFTVQVGSFSTLANAQKLKMQMDATHQNVHIVTYDGGGQTFYRVRAGLCHTLDQAKSYEAALIQKGFADAFIIAE